MHRLIRRVAAATTFGVAAFFLAASIQGQEKKPEFPPLEKITEGFKKIEIATPQQVEGQPAPRPFYNIWVRKKDGQMLAELPKDTLMDTGRPSMHFVATTIASGLEFAGLQGNERYVYWRRYDKRMALVEKNVSIVSKGDSESKSSVKRLFTDTVLFDVPILTIAPRGGPVIDMDSMLLAQFRKFFGTRNMMGESISVGKPYLAKIKKAKVFPNNVELALEVPSASGKLTTFHYSFSKVTGSSGYKPRKADERIGYFTTGYTDLGSYDEDKKDVYFINRWHLEKRDPSLKLSYPKKAITFYLEHTTPVRYRRWVQTGVEYWNKAFEKVGILNAIKVEHQDAQTGAHMDKDPEDVNYNFIRWLNNDVSTAVGPSRVHPETGQILDADIVLTDGWIRTFERDFDEVMPKMEMQGYSDETLQWFVQHPDWDPRVRLVSPEKRDFVQRAIAREAASRMFRPQSGTLKTQLMGDEEYDGLIGRSSSENGHCLAADGRTLDIATMRMMLAIDEKEKEEKKDDEKKEEKKEEPKEKEPMLDGMPETFIGPLLADLVAHEVGHTLGLRHNFKASSIYTHAEINSDEHKDKKTLAGSVMDYLPTNFNFEGGKAQGNYAMIGIGPYDYWAIEYGYTFDNDLGKILKRAGEPELTYGTDEDTSSADPLSQRYDFSKNPLDYAKNQVRLAAHHRGRILEHFVKDGDSWSKARRGYLITLNLQLSGNRMMSRWVGGAFISRHKKGDTDKAPIEVVPVAKQRDALKFILENTMRDAAYGLTPDLLNRMTVQKIDFNPESSTWAIHDRIGSIQASALSSLMNPTTLKQVYDNEFRIPADQDALTLPEMLNTIEKEIWSEIAQAPKGNFTTRKPMISSLRRNLQREHLNRLLDLVLDKSSRPASRTISTLASMKLEALAKEDRRSGKSQHRRVLKSSFG